MKTPYLLILIFQFSVFASPYSEFKESKHLELHSIEKRSEIIIENISLSVVSKKSASTIFKSMEKLSYIPFEFIEDGCYAQAHEISLVLKEFGIKTGKIFIKPNNGKLLIPEKTMYLAYDSFAGWKYHVAPLLIVQTKSGEEHYVIDPSTGDDAQTIEQWAKSMGLEKGQYDTTFRSPEMIFQDSSYETEDSIMEDLIDMNNMREEMGEDDFWWAYLKGLI